MMNTGVQIVFKSLLSGLFGYIPTIELLDHAVILCFKFLRNLHTVFYKGHTILHSHQQHTRLWLLFLLFPFPSSSISAFPPYFLLSQLKLTSYSPLNLGNWITLLVQLSNKLFLKMVGKVRWTPDFEKRSGISPYLLWCYVLRNLAKSQTVPIVSTEKLKIDLPYDPAITVLGIYSKKNMICLKGYVYPNDHCSIVYNSQDMEAI